MRIGESTNSNIFQNIDTSKTSGSFSNISTFDQFLKDARVKVSKVSEKDLIEMKNLHNTTVEAEKKGKDVSQLWMDIYNIAGKYMPRQSFEKFSSDMSLDTKNIDSIKLKSMKDTYNMVTKLEEIGKKKEANKLMDQLMRTMEPHMPRPKLKDYLTYFRVETKNISAQSLRDMERIHDRAVTFDRSRDYSKANAEWTKLFGMAQKHMVQPSFETFLSDMNIDEKKITAKDLDLIKSLFEKREQSISNSNFVRADYIWKKLMDNTDKYIPNKPMLWIPINGGIKFDRFLPSSDLNTNYESVK